MSLEHAIIEALRTHSETPGALTDPATGRQHHINLQKALRLPVADRTDYRRGRCYFFETVVPAPAEGVWQYALRIRVSGAGPFAIHTLMQRFAQTRWWAGSVRPTRGPLSEAQAGAIERLRAWYHEAGLTEVDPETQALPTPADAYPGRREAGTLSRSLFGDYR